MQGRLELPKGCFPTMITPFVHDGSAVDWPRLDAMVDWYIDRGCTGLFAVCQSSEMYNMLPTERLDVARRVVARAANRVPVVACGAFGVAEGRRAYHSMDETAAFVVEMGKIVNAVVIVVSQMCGADDDEAVWISNVSELLSKTGSVPLGLYECPQPYHRILTAGTLKWCVESGRFFFHKDTCCNKAGIVAKIEAVRETANTTFRFYNANAATLLDSVKMGGHGFSGICANFYPQLLSWLCAHADDDRAAEVQQFLSVGENVVCCKYPASAKKFLALDGFSIQPFCRNSDNKFSEEELLKIGDLHAMADRLSASLGLEYPLPKLS